MMSILELLARLQDEMGMPLPEIFARLDELFDDYYSEPGERRRFIQACRRLSVNDTFILQECLGGKCATSEISNRVKEVESPLRMARALLVLQHELSRTTSCRLLTFVVKLSEMHNVLKGLRRLYGESWANVLIKNSNLPEEAIRTLWALQREYYMASLRSYELLQYITHLKHCPSDILKDILSYDYPAVRNGIAHHRNTDRETALFFVNSRRKAERMGIASSHHVPADILLSLMKDKHDDVSATARAYFLKRFPAGELTDDAIDKAVAENISAPYQKPAKPKEKFDPYAARDLGFEHILGLKRPSERKRVAAIVSDPEVLRHLAKDTSKEVRRVVAGRTSCPMSELERLVGDDDLQTSNAAVESICKLQPERIIEDLLDIAALNRAYENLNVHINQWGATRTYDLNLTSFEQAELQRSMLIARHTRNPLVQGRIGNDLVEIPEMDTIRWHLVGKVASNPMLSDRMVRKFACELGFAEECVLSRCSNPSILNEFLEKRRIPPGVRGRIERRYAELISARSN